MTPYDRAYVEAGFSNTPWARYNANRLAHDPAVAARIAELRGEFEERSQIHVEYLQRKLLPIIEANAQDLFTTWVTPDGRALQVLKSISAMPRDLAAAIKKIKCDPETGAITEIDLYGKIEAGSVLLRSVGGLVDRLKVSDDDIAGMTQEEIRSYILEAHRKNGMSQSALDEMSSTLERRSSPAEKSAD